MTTSASRGIVTVTSLRLCSRAPETTIWACRDTRSSVRNARTDPSNTCSPGPALCGRDSDRVGTEPETKGRSIDQLGAIRESRASAAASRRGATHGRSGSPGGRRRSPASCSRCDRSSPPVDGIGVVFALVGGSFCAFGLIAWHRRPDSLGGALMTATGFLFFAAPVLGPLEAPLAFTAYVLVVDLWIFPFVALLLTFLTAGRLQARLRPPAGRLVRAARGRPASCLAPDRRPGRRHRPHRAQPAARLPGHRLRPHHPRRLQRGSLAFLGTVTVVVIVARWLRASGPRRRAMLPSLAGAFALACFAALLVNDLISGSRSQLLLWCAACSLVAVPAAFLTGLLRSRLARGGLAELVRDLGSAHGAELERALARTLGDPQLRVAYWLPEDPTPTRTRRAAGRAAGARRRPRRRARRA